MPANIFHPKGTEQRKIEWERIGAGGDAVIKIGECYLPGEEGKRGHDCVTKKYNDTPTGRRQFSHVVQTLCIMKHAPEMNDYWADIRDIDYKNMTVTTVYLYSKTLKDILEGTDIFQPENTGLLKTILKLLDNLLVALKSNRIYHGDLHMGNLYLQQVDEYPNQSRLKVIDYDDIEWFDRVKHQGRDLFSAKPAFDRGKMINALLATGRSRFSDIEKRRICLKICTEIGATTLEDHFASTMPEDSPDPNEFVDEEMLKMMESMKMK